MTRGSESNHPGGQEPGEKVRQLQRKLYVAAKQQKGRRFHALFDRIYRSDVLFEAWMRVKRNKGAAGVDGFTLEAVEQYGVGKLVRYADDFVVLCTSHEGVEEAERRVRIIFERLKLTLHPEKTRRVDLTDGKEGFDFLGCHLHMRMSGKLWEEKRIRRYNLQRWPSKRSMKRVQARVNELTDSRPNGVKDVDVLIRDLNPALRGWGNYFRTGNAALKLRTIDRFVVDRLNVFRWKRYRRHVKPGQRIRWERAEYEAHGLHRLRGTIRYPKPCMLHRESPPVSRVPEIGTHGLKGGGGIRTA